MRSAPCPIRRRGPLALLVGSMALALASCGSGPDAGPAVAPSSLASTAAPSVAPSPAPSPTAPATAAPPIAVRAGRLAAGTVDDAVPVALRVQADGSWLVRLALDSGGDDRVVVSSDASRVESGPEDLDPSVEEQLAEQALLAAARLDFKEAGERIAAAAPLATLQELSLTMDGATTLWQGRLSRVDRVVRRVRPRGAAPNARRRRVVRQVRRVVVVRLDAASGVVLSRQ